MKMICVDLTKRFRKLLSTGYIFYAVITLLLVLAAFAVFSITADGFGMDDNAKLNEFYAPLENGFVTEARSYLNDCGYINPGVSLTHTTDENLCRIYTLKIHHRKLEGISTKELNKILSDISAFGFEDDRCTIRVSII